MRTALETREANKKVCRENTLSTKKIPITVRVGRAVSSNSPLVPPLRDARCRTDKCQYSFLAVAYMPLIGDEVWYVFVRNSRRFCDGKRQAAAMSRSHGVGSCCWEIFKNAIPALQVTRCSDQANRKGENPLRHAFVKTTGTRET